VGAGSVTLPGLPTQSTPAFVLQTTSFSINLVADVLDLGLIAFHGNLVFERVGGVFQLRLTNPTRASTPSLEIKNVVSIPLPSFTIASNGTFTVDGSVPNFGPAGLRLVGASLHIQKSTVSLVSLNGQINGGRLLVGSGTPINLPRLTFDNSTPIDVPITVPSWSLGPFLSATSAQLRLHSTPTGLVLDLQNTPSVSALAGSASVVFNSFSASTDGSFAGSISGRLALFGLPLAQATFDVSLSGGVVQLRLPASRAAGIDLGFMRADLSGFMRSDGTFDFTGSAAAKVGVIGLSLDGSVSVEVSSSTGVTGSFSGTACIVLCTTVAGSVRSDGQVTGLYQFAGIDAAWVWYMASGGVGLDLNRDGDYVDFGEFFIGTATSSDTTAPTMTTHANVTVRAALSAGDQVLVYYTLPTATDSGVAVPVNCAPARGAVFAVGATTVSCSATDSAGNTRTRSFTVTVINDATVTTPTTTNGIVLVI
jgi:hypothetical protein